MGAYRNNVSLAELSDRLDAFEERIEALELFHQGREKCSGDLALDKLDKQVKDYKVISTLVLVAFFLILIYSVMFKGSPVPEEEVINVNFIEVELVECMPHRY